MAQQGPGARAQALNRFFRGEYGFEPEKYMAGAILYKRHNAQGVLERIVVKHDPFPVWAHAGARDEEIDTEENFLRRLWGAEHTIRLMSIIDDRYHRAPVKWAPPINRNLLNPPPILPWKLAIDPARYRNATTFGFFVMEFLCRGSGEELIERCQAMGIGEISEPLLWCFFLCLIRGCIGMAYPPNSINRDPPVVEREVFPRRRRAPSRISHSDLHLGNIVFGDYEFQIAQPDCHQIIPILKIIDFGLAHEDYVAEDAQRANLKFVGELMHQLARVAEDPVIDERLRPRYMVRNIPGVTDFATYATADFWRARNLSDDFKLLVSQCLAVDDQTRPILRPVLAVCERNVALTPNWTNLRDEVYELFEAVPLFNNGSDSGSEYEP